PRAVSSVSDKGASSSSSVLLRLPRRFEESSFACCSGTATAAGSDATPLDGFFPPRPRRPAGAGAAGSFSSSGRSSGCDADAAARRVPALLPTARDVIFFAACFFNPLLVEPSGASTVESALSARFRRPLVLLGAGAVAAEADPGVSFSSSTSCSAPFPSVSS
ncbi:unnamed protein product, partial [Ectocarpus sp. 12 AP-2014]